MKVERIEKLRIALGWKPPKNYDTDEYAKTDEDLEDAYTNYGWVLEDWSEYREAWEFEPNHPAINEPMFLSWIEKNGYEWQINTCRPHDQFEKPHIAVWVHGGPKDVEFEAEGETSCEARLNVIIAMGEEMNHEAENRKLAEWLGVKLGPCGFDGGCLAENCVRMDGSYTHEPPDFYASEEANAMLLEKMPNASLQRRRDTNVDEWYCVPDQRIESKAYAQVPDRKAAIANAALALIKAEGK